MLYQFRKEGTRLKNQGQDRIIHCYFTEEGEHLQELIWQSLRAFIKRNLQNSVAF